MFDKKYRLLGLLLLFTTIARADWVVLPDSHHQQFQTFGLFFDEQSTLVLRQEGRAWGAIAANVPLVGNEDWKWKPQLVVHSSANASFQFNDKGDTLLTETVDARVGLAIELSFDETFRGSIIWTHQSGHISDNVPDRDLFGLNLGNEIIAFRLIKDFDRRVRVGGELRPTVGSDPGMVGLGGDQFAEYFFNGESDDPHRFSPFIAAGFEEWGRHFIRLTSHVQVGFVVGPHFSKDHRASLRTVLGYYNGNDPRMKYYQFKDRRVDYFYGGLMFDI